MVEYQQDINKWEDQDIKENIEFDNQEELINKGTDKEQEIDQDNELKVEEEVKDEEPENEIAQEYDENNGIQATNIHGDSNEIKSGDNENRDCHHIGYVNPLAKEDNSKNVGYSIYHPNPLHHSRLGVEKEEQSKSQNNLFEDAQKYLLEKNKAAQGKIWLLTWFRFW